MMRPLHDKVVVELADSIPTPIPGFIIPIVTDKFRSKDGAVETYNRGTVVAVGPGKRDPKTGKPIPMHFHSPQGVRSLKAGDVIRFSELEYYEFKEDGKRFVIISDSDVGGVEVLEHA